MGCSPPGSSVHGILQARILECVAIPSPAYITTHYSYQLGIPICRNISWSSFQTSLGIDSTFLFPSVRCDVFGYSRIVLILRIYCTRFCLILYLLCFLFFFLMAMKLLLFIYFFLMPWYSFSECWTLSQIFHSPLSLSFFFNFYFYFILLYNTVLVLPYIDLNPPWVSLTQTFL